MYFNHDTYVGQQLINAINNIEKKTLSHLVTNLDYEFETLYFTGSGFDFYLEPNNTRAVIFSCKSSSDYINEKLDICKSDLNDIYLYLQWLQNAKTF